MIYDVETFDDIVKLPIRPQAQFYLRDMVNILTGWAIAENVLNNNVYLNNYSVAPNPNNLCGVTLAKNGYKVDDPNLRMYNDTNYCNLMFNSLLITQSTPSRTLLNRMQQASEEVVTVSITIAPVYMGSFRFDWIKYNVDTDEILSTQSTTLTDTDDYEDLEFSTDTTDTETAYKLMVTALNSDAYDCRINFDQPQVVGRSKYIITNSNLVQYSSNEYADLYSQIRSNCEHTVEFLDLEHLYDPQNPNGKYSNLILGSTYQIFRGYNINGMFIDAYSTNWAGTKVSYRLKDLPVWDNEKVKLILVDSHTFNSNLTTQIPTFSYNGGVVSKVFADLPESPTSYDYSKQILKQMTYYIRFVSGPYSYANAVAMTIEDSDKAAMETTGYLQDDCPIEDVYALVQNALGCWNYGKNVSDISAANVKDYTIDNSIIYDQGLSFSKQPLLKTLTIKKYNHTKSASPISYTVSLTADDFEQWSETSARPYRGELKIDNPLRDIAAIKITSDVSGWNYMWVYDRDLISGLCDWKVYVTVASPASGVGDYTLTLYPMETNIEEVSEVVNEEGENLTIDNPFITSDALVTLCANTAKTIANWREVYEIDVMENFKLQIGDIVKLDTMYETDIPVIITGLQFNIPGPKGHITCRRIG